MHNDLARLMVRPLLALLFCLSAIPVANAHLMVAQQGTLNVVDDGAFMVISLPASAFAAVDDDGDGKLSGEEFTVHQADLRAAVKRGIQLRDSEGPRPLQGLMLTPVISDAAPLEPVTQLIAMGRFALSNSATALELDMSLFGTAIAERTQQITISRPADGRQQLLVLTPERPTHALFTSGWSIFNDYLEMGMGHIVQGFDHLLFLLVVLVTGWGWRQILLALSVFTLGHALTLTITNFYSIPLSPAVIEPAIAATIVAMAGYALFNRQRNQKTSEWLLLSAVFACSLVHGLGIASALQNQGLDTGHLLTSLAGFNLGIEAGQLLVAMLVAVVAIAIQRLRGNADLEIARHSTSLLAIAIGGFWFMQRVI